MLYGPSLSALSEILKHLTRSCFFLILWTRPSQFYFLHQMIPYNIFATILPCSPYFQSDFFLKSHWFVYLHNYLSKPLGPDLTQKSEVFGFEKALTPVVWYPRWDLGQHPMIITLLFLHWNVRLFTLSEVSKGCRKLHFSPGQVLLPNEVKKPLIFLELLDFGIMHKR